VSAIAHRYRQDALQRLHTGTCGLHDFLIEGRIDTIIISGTLTNCCCGSTDRDAMQMNYRVREEAGGRTAAAIGLRKGSTWHFVS
jgi:ureidoacrylate peracid hydrolase